MGLLLDEFQIAFLEFINELTDAVLANGGEVNITLVAIELQSGLFVQIIEALKLFEDLGGGRGGLKRTHAEDLQKEGLEMLESLNAFNQLLVLDDDPVLEFGELFQISLDLIFFKNLNFGLFGLKPHLVLGLLHELEEVLMVFLHPLSELVVVVFFGLHLSSQLLYPLSFIPDLQLQDSQLL